MLKLYSVAVLTPREVVHCDLVYDSGRLTLYYLASKGRGRTRRGLSRNIDMFLYKLEKMRTKSSEERKVFAELDVEDVLCWKVEEHTKKGLAREYENTVLFILKTRKGVYRMLVSKKALHVLEELIKKLKREDVPRCKTL